MGCRKLLAVESGAQAARADLRMSFTFELAVDSRVPREVLFGGLGVRLAWLIT